MRFIPIATLFLSLVSICAAQTTAVPASAAISYDGEAMVVDQFDTVIRYNADGTGSRDIHLRTKIQSEAGARQFSVIAFPYAAANESLQVQSLMVLHADGTTTETPASDAIDMPAPVTREAPLYSDLKQQQIPVRGLRIGDTLEYRVHVERKSAEAPGQYWGNFSFLTDVVVLAQSLTLDVPAEKYVQVWSPKLKPVMTESAGRRIYKWSGSQLKPTSTAQKKESDPPEPPADKKPLMAWTTFHTWKEVGDWYLGLASPRAAPTDALRAKANEIAAQAKTPEDQVQALYSFVATRIRYVGIDLGIGRYQPHQAAEVLANQYGDCKDKDTLLEALLRAKGFAPAPALIGVNIDMVPELPSPALFNHVITTVALPGGKIWMDTTSEVAPFRLLLPQIRDKDALVMPATAASALEHTPAALPFPFVDHFEAKAKLNADGELTGHVEITDRSDSEVMLRTIARNIAPAQWDQGTQYLANLMGFSGQTSHSTFGRPEETSGPMHIAYDYTRKPFGDWDNLRIVPLFPVVFLPGPPDKQPSEEIDLGALRTETSTSRIELPEKFGAELPDAIHVKTPFLTFDKTYRLEGSALIAERTVRVLQAKIPASEWQQYKKFCKDASLEQELWVQLTGKSADLSIPITMNETESNASAARLVADATILERKKDWSGALKKLDEAKKIEPKQPFLWSNYGYIAMVNHDAASAKEDLKRELSLQPGNANIGLMYASFLHQQGDDAAAIEALKPYLHSETRRTSVALLMASLQSHNDLAEAIATLRQANAEAPNDHTIQDRLAEYLIWDHKTVEATALAYKVLQDAEDPGLLNSGAYLLAEAKSDLPQAELNARKALDKMDSDTAIAAISEANNRSFQRTNLLVATWDTLGLILLEEKKLDEAKDYLEAAWRNRPDPEIGEHFGQLLELQGDEKGALRIYQLALSGHAAEDDLAAKKRIVSGIERVNKAGVSTALKSDPVLMLQAERSFPVEIKPALPKHAWATFRLQLAADSIQDVLKVNGDALLDGASLDAAKDAIKTTRLPHLIPSHSKARILRDSILSCSVGKTVCELVLTPLGDMNVEAVGEQ